MCSFELFPLWDDTPPLEWEEGEEWAEREERELEGMVCSFELFPLWDDTPPQEWEEGEEWAEREEREGEGMVCSFELFPLWDDTPPHHPTTPPGAAGRPMTPRQVLGCFSFTIVNLVWMFSLSITFVLVFVNWRVSSPSISLTG